MTKARRIQMLVCIGVLGLIGYGVVHIVQDVRHRTHLAETRRNLKIIGLALHNYHDAHGTFPPAYVLGPDEKPWHSWRTLILPYMGAQELYDRYRFDEPWNGPHNSELFNERIENYRSSLAASDDPGITTYLAVVSRRSMWPAYFTMKVEDVKDGTANTLMVFQDVGSDVIWSEPRELNERSMMKLFDNAKDQSDDEAVVCVLFADGSARAVGGSVDRQLLISLLTPRFGEQSVADENWPEGLLAGERPTPPAFPDPVDPSNLSATMVAAVTDIPLKERENALYCATIQIAWDKARPALNQPIVVAPPTPLTDTLNAQPFPSSALSKDTYFAEAARWDTGDDAEMQQRFRERFPGAPTVFTPPPNVPGVRFFAYLQKSLPFVDVLDRHTAPLSFHDADNVYSVESFGHTATMGIGAGLPVLQDTVKIRDYISDDDFIIEFGVDSPEHDEIIIAKIERQETLKQTWRECERRLKQPRDKRLKPNLLAAEPLQVPILVFNLTTKFSELENVAIPTEAIPERYVAEVVQSMRLRLDEYGAELIADTQMIVGENGHSFDSVDEHEPPKPRQFIVDRAFLLALREKNAEAPYFVAWIANADLMEQFVDSEPK